MESSKVKIKVIIPVNTVFDFAGDGLNGKMGQLSVDCGAGMMFNELGRLILNLLAGGGLGYHNDALCINTCEVASRLAGRGLSVKDCKISVDFGDIAGPGLVQTQDGKVVLDTAALAGTGLVADPATPGRLDLDTGFLAGEISSQINNDLVVVPDLTLVVPFTISTTFNYKPNGYGYNSGIEIVSTTSTLVFYKNAGGNVVGVTQGPITQTSQDFDFGSGVPMNVAERQETPAAPNFYAKD